MGRVSRGPRVVPGIERLEARVVLAADAASSWAWEWPLDDEAMANFFVGRPQPAGVGTGPVLVALIGSGVAVDRSSPIPYAGDRKWLDFGQAYDAVTGRYGQDAVVDRAPNSPGTRSATYAARGIEDSVAAGGSPDVRIAPIRAFDPKLGLTPPYAVVNAIHHAIEIGADVIELDFVANQFEIAPGHRRQIEDALTRARLAGATVVVAAGNGFAGASTLGVDLDEPGAHREMAPADVHTANMLVVASTDGSGRLAPTSNWGATHVDLGASVAPAQWDTSAAAGYASGVAAVVAATRTDWSGTEVVNRIKQTVEPSILLANKVATGGLVSPADALRGISGVDASRARDDYEGDLASDLALYAAVAPVGQTFGKLSSTRGFDTSHAVAMNNRGKPFGLAGSIPVPGRYDGGPITQPAVLSPQLGPDGRPTGRYDFAILGTNADGSHYASTFVSGAAGPGDIAVAGDFTGSGRDDLALYGAHQGRYGFKVLVASLGFDPAQAIEVTDNGRHFGGAGDVPVAGDFFGNGFDSLGVFGPEYTEDGRYAGHYAFKALDAGSLDAQHRFTRSVHVAHFGGPGHLPVVGDFDGDRKDDLALYDDDFGGRWGFAVLGSSTGFDPGRLALVDNNGFGFGGPGSVPIAGDFDGDGVADPAVYGPESGPDGRPNGVYTFAALASGSLDSRKHFTRARMARDFGGPTAIPASAPPGYRAYRAGLA